MLPYLTMFFQPERSSPEERWTAMVIHHSWIAYSRVFDFISLFIPQLDYQNKFSLVYTFLEFRLAFQTLKSFSNQIRLDLFRSLDCPENLTIKLAEWILENLKLPKFKKNFSDIRQWLTCNLQVFVTCSFVGLWFVHSFNLQAVSVTHPGEWPSVCLPIDSIALSNSIWVQC